jgi:alkylation response protein AidB-like acyl-CoA dehydrogenase
MDFFTQLILFLIPPLVLYFVITALLKLRRPKRLYVCSLDSSPDIFTSLLPTDFYTKSQQPGNNDGGYLYPDDPDTVLQQLRTVVATLHSQGALISLDPYNLIVIHERLAYTNSNDLVNWFTVQFNLFAGSVSALGTATHAALVQDARELKKLGCFGLTEKSAGVLSGLLCETIAYYNQETKKIIIHTPNEDAKKCWISYAGNSQIEYAVVFAKWAQSSSIHSSKKVPVATSIGKLFLTPHVVVIVVQIRSSGVVLPGLRIEECYTRSDFRSNSFGSLTFTEFSTAPENLLDRYCSLDTTTGTLQVADNCPKLFFKLSNRLLVGRLCLSATTIICARVALQLVITRVYNSKRCQFSYITDHLQVMVQQVCEMDCYFRRLIKRFQIDPSSTTISTDELLEQNIDEILLIKAYVPPLCRSIVAKCRELLGAESLLAHNRIAESHASCYASCLAEGDSVVMAQAYVGQCMRKYKHLSLRNWRLLWLMMKILAMVPTHKRVNYINSHQTEVIAAFQQIADGIFQNQAIQSNIQSIVVPIMKA